MEGVSLSPSAERVLSPHHVEAVSPSSSTHVQIQDRGKRPMHDDGPSRGRDTDFTIIDVEASSHSSELKEIIREKKAENDSLRKKLQMAKWVINYLEQCKK